MSNVFVDISDTESRLVATDIYYIYWNETYTLDFRQKLSTISNVHLNHTNELLISKSKPSPNALRIVR